MSDQPINHKLAIPVPSDRVIGGDDDSVIELSEEQLTIEKRVVEGATVRVTTQTETHEEIAEVTLDHAKVDMERVPVNRPIDAVPMVRHEGDTMVVPVVEERVVITKQLYLVEELHIHQRVTQETVRQSVQLRRQHAKVERTDAQGNLLPAETAVSKPLD